MKELGLHDYMKMLKAEQDSWFNHINDIPKFTKEDKVKEFKRAQSFTIKKILDEYGKRGNGKICRDAELEARIHFEESMEAERKVDTNRMYDGLVGLSFAGVSAIEWLAANTPYYEEVVKEPVNGDIVRMCDMNDRQCGKIEDKTCSHNGRFVAKREGLSDNWKILMYGENGSIVDQFHDTARYNVRLCELDISEKVEGEG